MDPGPFYACQPPPNARNRSIWATETWPFMLASSASDSAKCSLGVEQGERIDLPLPLLSADDAGGDFGLVRARPAELPSGASELA